MSQTNPFDICDSDSKPTECTKFNIFLRLSNVFRCVLKLVQLAAAMIFDRFNSMRWPQCINDVNMVKREKKKQRKNAHTHAHNVIKIQFSHHLNFVADIQNMAIE